MTDGDWRESFARAFQVFLNGDSIAEPDGLGERIVDDSFLLLFNAAANAVDFTLPPDGFGTEWTCVVDTDHKVAVGEVVKAGDGLTIADRSCVILTRGPVA
jgi:glycogen operon protein